MKTRYGTAYFVSEERAIEYYSDYEDDPARGVKQRLREGSIHIGKPALKAGQSLELNLEEGRYFITESGVAA